MREHHDTVKRLISAIEDPRPPRLLRERTLSRAEAAWDRSPAPDRWSRAWHSRPLRLVCGQLRRQSLYRRWQRAKGGRVGER